jgi:hypothetical protein
VIDISRAFEVSNGVILNNDSDIEGPFLTGGSSSPIGLDLPLRTIYFRNDTNKIKIYLKVGLTVNDWREVSAQDILFDNSIANLPSNPQNVKAALEQLDARLDILDQYACYANTDTTTNINTGNNFSTTVPIFGTANIPNAAYTFDFFNQRIVTNFGGRVKISWNVYIGGGVSRGAPEFRTIINGNPVGPVGASTYIRDNQGHDTSSAHISNWIVTVANGSQISLGSQRGARNGTITMESSQSSWFTIERLS